MNVEEINVLLDRVETVLRSQNKIEAEFLIKDGTYIQSDT